MNSGSSLKAAKKMYGKQYKSFEQCYQLRESVAAYAMESGIKCIAGHVPWSRNIMENTSKKYLFVTILRDPVQRFISKYLYNFHKSGEHCRVHMTLPDYLNSGEGIASGREYIRYLSDVSMPGEEPISRLVKKSKENILKLDVVGFLEDLNDFITDFHQKTGIKLRIPHKNQTRNLTEEQTFDPATIDRINEVCKYDIEIYQYARKHHNLQT